MLLAGRSLRRRPLLPQRLPSAAPHLAVTPLVILEQIERAAQTHRRQMHRRPRATSSRPADSPARACFDACRSVELAGPRRERELGFAAAVPNAGHGSPSTRTATEPTRAMDRRRSSRAAAGSTHLHGAGHGIVSRFPALAVRSLLADLVRRRLLEGPRRHAGRGGAGPQGLQDPAVFSDGPRTRAAPCHSAVVNVAPLPAAAGRGTLKEPTLGGISPGKALMLRLSARSNVRLPTAGEMVLSRTVPQPKIYQGGVPSHVAAFVGLLAPRLPYSSPPPL